MNFCSHCANPVSLTIPQGDTRPRYVCNHCQKIHYENPRLVIGSIPVWEQQGQLQILLCKRAIEPRYGYWTLPGGFMENGETTCEAAVRETVEESGANIQLLPLFSMLDIPHINQVHLFYRATLLDLNYLAGEESLEVQLFSQNNLPWDNLAFSTVSYTLRCFFADHSAGANYGFHTWVCPQRHSYDEPAQPGQSGMAGTD